MKIDKKILKQIALKTKKDLATTTKNNSKMPNTGKPEAEDQLFQSAFADIKPLSQDKVMTRQQKSKGKKSLASKEKSLTPAEFHFSDQYEPQLPSKGAMKYVKEGVSSFESKALRRGDYIPELILDLHGLNQQQAKRELAALLLASKKQHVNCVCIVHGIGSRVLKNKIPHYLVQHPDVLAFHQATLEWGGDGALLVLLAVEER